MCAIAGYLNHHPSSQADLSLLRRMADSQRHRGPDGEGFFLRPRVGFAHRRLSIIGGANGKQPLFSEDGNIVAVVNGEFFNYREQRAELIQRGHRFSTESDCEIVVHLWEEFGIEMLKHLRGQFAIALWDRNKGKVILARDRFGIVPLHWCETQSGLLFSSEIKGLLASGMVNAAPDHRGIDNLFSFFSMPGRRTCFEGIASLLPGHYLEFNTETGEFGEHLYWDFEFPDAGDEVRGKSEQLVSEFGLRLSQATGLRMRADVPVGCYLSGGVDSTTLLQLAANQPDFNAKGIPSFTIEIPSGKLNELPEARIAAEQVGSPLTSITCNATKIGNAYKGLVRASEAPVMDTSSAALFCLSDLVSNSGIKTVLSGEGADEALAGYPWFKANRLISLFDHGDFMPSNFVRRIVGKLKGRPVSWAEAKNYQEIIGGAPALSDFYGLLRQGRWMFYSEEMWERIGEHSPYSDISLPQRDKLKDWHPLNQSLYFGYKTILPGLLMNQKGDRPAMAHSVEVRYPFLDEDVVDFCTALDPKWKLRGLTKDKLVLREFASGMLPPKIMRRTKHIFRAPFASTFFSNPPDFVQQLVSPESLRKTGYFSETAVRGAYGDYATHRKGKPRNVVTEMAFTAVMATQLWHHLFLGGGLCELDTWSPPATRPSSNQQGMFAEPTLLVREPSNRG